MLASHIIIHYYYILVPITEAVYSRGYHLNQREGWSSSSLRRWFFSSTTWCLEILINLKGNQLTRYYIVFLEITLQRDSPTRFFLPPMFSQMDSSQAAYSVFKDFSNLSELIKVRIIKSSIWWDYPFTRNHFRYNALGQLHVSWNLRSCI
jgi:hypothetical protein